MPSFRTQAVRLSSAVRRADNRIHSVRQALRISLKSLIFTIGLFPMVVLLQAIYGLFTKHDPDWTPVYISISASYIGLALYMSIGKFWLKENKRFEYYVAFCPIIYASILATALVCLPFLTIIVAYIWF
jgi:hypothetical protein